MSEPISVSMMTSRGDDRCAGVCRLFRSYTNPTAAAVAALLWPSFLFRTDGKVSTLRMRMKQRHRLHAIYILKHFPPPLKLLGESARDCFSASLIGGVGEQMAPKVFEGLWRKV